MKRIFKEFEKKFSSLHNDKPSKNGSKLQRSTYTREHEHSVYRITIERIGVK